MKHWLSWMKTSLLLMIAILMACMLASCQHQEADDLTQFMNDADSSLVGKIEPLPQVQPFIAQQYNADGRLLDPFVPRKTLIKSVNQPDLKRKHEPLEAYPLESLKFVGVLSRQHKIYALIQSTDNLIYQVGVGQYMGDRLGLITALAENPRSMKYEITVRETLQDVNTGEWTVQMKTLELQDNH